MGPGWQETDRELAEEWREKEKACRAICPLGTEKG